MSRFCKRRVPAFRTCTFVIELHEAFVPGVTERCRRMFAHMRRMSSEARGPQQWLVLTPLASAGH